MIAIIFHPLGLKPFIQCPMSELYNRYIDVEDLEDIELNHLRISISSERNIQTCIQFIELFFMKRLVNRDFNHQRVQNSISQIINHPQNRSEYPCGKCLSRDIGSFKRIFTNNVGMSP